MSPQPRQYAYKSGAGELNLEFYRLYDPYFLVSKAVGLHQLVHRPDIRELLLTDGDLEQLGFTLDEQYRDRLRAELYFTELHQFEAMLALLLALFQDLPHWIFLTDYPPGEIEDKARNLASSDASSLTGGRYTSLHEFVELAVYGELRPSTEELKRAWPDNINNLAGFLRHQAQRYLDGLPAYNAYKHGLRLAAGTGSIGVALTGQPMSLVATSPNTLTYLERHRVKKGLYRLEHVMTEFKPEASMAFLIVMSHVLEMVKASRLHILDQEVDRYVLFLNCTDDWLAEQEGGSPISFKFTV